MKKPQCILCHGQKLTLKLTKSNGQVYWECYDCKLIFLDPLFYLSPDAEKAHYLAHNNDILDKRYQRFVSPIVNYVTSHVPKGSLGLDFGAGTGPVISYLLEKLDYKMKLYDPFFWQDQFPLSIEYDFVVACEVIEHFHAPAEEFLKLKSLLKKNGQLVIMTELFKDDMQFETWYYHCDPTHVAFYRLATMEWICHHYNFTQLIPNFQGRAFILKN